MIEVLECSEIVHPVQVIRPGVENQEAFCLLNRQTPAYRSQVVTGGKAQTKFWTCSPSQHRRKTSQSVIIPYK